MIKSVVRQYRWTPEIINNLYVDAIDHEGLIFWYNDCVEIDMELQKTKEK